MMTRAESLEWDNLIRRAVRNISYNFPYINLDDLGQDLWIWILERKQDTTPDQPGMYAHIRRQAKRLAWAQRVQQMQDQGNYYYLTGDVREILETLFYYNEWVAGYTPADAQTKDDTGAIEVRVDVSSAFGNLPRAVQEVLMIRYRDKEIPAANSAEERALSRGVKLLADTLNMNYAPGKRRRRVITNATSRYIIENQEDQ